MDRMTEGSDEGLNERAQLLLKALIENYIRDGQPVGSRTLSRDSGLSLSSATIRNVMADLEDLGFVASPHTSAGRIPTDKGYRFFVDTLLKLKPLHHEEIEEIERRLGGEASNGRSPAVHFDGHAKKFDKIVDMWTIMSIDFEKASKAQRTSFGL